MDSIYANIQWAIKNTNGSYNVKNQYNNQKVFPVHLYKDSLLYHPDSMIIRAILDGDTIYFNFKFKNSTILNDYFRDSIFKNPKYTDYPISSDNNSIALPTLDSGEYVISFLKIKNIYL